MILDMSGSTDEATLKKTKLVESLQRIVHYYNHSRYFLISVGTTPTIILDGSSDENSMSKQISKLLSKRRQGGTALYDACYLGVEKLMQGMPANRSVILVSDGIDTMSIKSFRDVENTLIENKVRVYAINMRSKVGPTTKAIDILNAMSSSSGGLAYHPKKSEELDAIVDSIVLEMQK